MCNLYIQFARFGMTLRTPVHDLRACTTTCNYLAPHPTPRAPPCYLLGAPNKVCAQCSQWHSKCITTRCAGWHLLCSECNLLC